MTASQNPLYTEEEIQALNKIRMILNHKGEDNEPISFTKEEEKVLRHMIEIYETIVSFGRVGLLIKNMIIGMAAFLAAALVVYHWSTSGLKSILGIE